MALGGEAYLNFMGNEMGHPEWIDFPREGNDWSYKYCRRQWNLADEGHLRYTELLEFDEDCMKLDGTYGFVSSPTQWVTMMDDRRQILVAERGPLVFVFNFNPFEDFDGLKVPVPEPGKYKIVLDADKRFASRVGWDAEHFSSPVEDEAFGGYERGQYIKVLAPRRSATVFVKDEEKKQAPEKARDHPKVAKGTTKERTQATNQS
jgi:1,4-alpha-glucan branching enzyme